MDEPLLKDADLLQKVFDSIPSILLIVDSDVRIYHLNLPASNGLGLDITDIYLKRCGEILRCIHAFEVPEGCGHTEHCKDCIVRNSVNNAIKGNRVYREKTKIEVIKNNNIEHIYLMVTASPFEYKENRYVLLVLEDISEIIELKKILPICANCKKIRNDENYWEEVERYFKNHMEIEFTHGICQDCAKKLYPELNNKISNF